MRHSSRITSSNISQVHYTEDTSTLTVEFNSKNTYNYYDVPKQLYEEMMKSPSPGEYFRKNVYKSYKYQKVQ